MTPALPTFLSVPILSDALLLRIGHAGIPIPSLPATEPWVGWFIAGLFFLLGLTHVIDGYTIPGSFDISFKVKERDSIFAKTTLQNPWAQSLLFVFQLCILALAAHVLMRPADRPFEIATTFRFLLVMGAYSLVKYLILKLIEYVFFHKNPAADLWIRTYFKILSAYCLLLLPILTAYIYVPDKFSIVPAILLIINTLAASCILLAKLFQLFFHKKLALFYILLYLCALEILPLCGLYFVLKICI